MIGKVIIGLLTLILTMGCANPIASPAPEEHQGPVAAPAPEEDQGVVAAPAPEESQTSPPRPSFSTRKSIDLGPFVYDEFPIYLHAGDQFSGSVVARRDRTVLIRIEDPRGVNHAPSQCVKYWEWDMTVAREGKWMLYVENTKWLDIVDVDLEWEITS